MRDVINPFDGEVIQQVADATAADVGRAVGAARTAFDEGPWRRLAARERGTFLFRIADAIRAKARGVRRGRDPQHGQADRRSGVRRRRRRALLRVLRRPRLQDPRRDARRARQRAVDRGPRTGRGGRPDHSVELPAADGGLEAGAGTGRRLHGRAEAGGADADHRVDAGRDCCSSSICPRAWSTSSPATARRRRRAGRRSARRQDRVHRRRGHRTAGHQERRRYRQADVDRARRQESEHRVRRRRFRGRGRRRAVRRVREPGRSVLGGIPAAGGTVDLRPDAPGAGRRLPADPARRIRWSAKPRWGRS